MGLPVLVLTRVLMVPFLAVCNMTACIWLTWSKVDTSSVDTTYGKRYTSKGHARHQLVKVFGHADTDANQRACLYDTKCLGHSVMLSTIKKSATSLRLVFAF